MVASAGDRRHRPEFLDDIAFATATWWREVFELAVQTSNDASVQLFRWTGLHQICRNVGKIDSGCRPNLIHGQRFGRRLCERLPAVCLADLDPALVISAIAVSAVPLRNGSGDAAVALLGANAASGILEGDAGAAVAVDSIPLFDAAKRKWPITFDGSPATLDNCRASTVYLDIGGTPFPEAVMESSDPAPAAPARARNIARRTWVMSYLLYCVPLVSGRGVRHAIDNSMDGPNTDLTKG